MFRAAPCSSSGGQSVLECVWNVMAHAQKPDIVFRQNGRVHLNRRGRQFSRLLAAEVCASAVVMLDTLIYLVVWSGVNGNGYPLHSPVSPLFPLPCVAVCRHVSTGLYHSLWYRHYGNSYLNTPLHISMRCKWWWFYVPSIQGLMKRTPHNTWHNRVQKAPVWTRLCQVLW